MDVRRDAVFETEEAKANDEMRQEGSRVAAEEW